MKKSLSIILLVCMLLSMFAGTGFTLRSEDGEELVSGMAALAPVAEEAPQEEAPIEEPPVEEPPEEEPPAEEPSSEEAPIVSGNAALIPVETETAAPEAEEAEEAEAPAEDGATQSNVPYIDEDGTTKYAATAEVVPTCETTEWDGSAQIKWVVVTEPGVTIAQGAVVKGDVRLILADGASLTVQGTSNSAGINVSGSNSLTIYGQSGGTGTLTATGGNYGAGIGGDISGTGNNGGTVTINGGIVIATGGSYSAGIGGAATAKGGTVTINGGTVTATGSANAGGIGRGYQGSGNGTVYVATDLEVKAGSTTPPTDSVANTGADIAASLAGKRYVTVKKAPSNYTLVLSEGKVYKSTDNGATNGTEATTAATDYGIAGSDNGNDSYTYAFKNVNFTTTASTAIYVKDTNAAITLTGTNTVKGGDSTQNSCYGIYAYSTGAKLTISGEGSLTVTGGESTNGKSLNSYGFYANDFTISSGTINTTGSKADSTSCGIRLEGKAAIGGGAIHGTSGSSNASYGVYLKGVSSITGGMVNGTGGMATTNSYGIFGRITSITGGTVNGTGGTVTNSYGIRFTDTVSVSGGTITASGNKQAIAKVSGLTLNGVTVTAGSSADGTGAATVANATFTGNLGSYKYAQIKEIPVTLVLSGGKVYKSTDNGETYEGAEVTDSATKYGIAGSDNGNDSYTYAFKKVNFTTEAATAIKITDTTAAITLEGSNTVTGGDSATEDCFGIRANNTGTKLTISGEGSLTVSGGDTTGDKKESIGIVAQKLLISGGTIIAKGGDGAVCSAGIVARNGLTITDGDVYAEADTADMYSLGIYAVVNDSGAAALELKGGKLTAISVQSATGEQYGLDVWNLSGESSIGLNITGGILIAQAGTGAVLIENGSVKIASSQDIFAGASETSNAAVSNDASLKTNLTAATAKYVCVKPAPYIASVTIGATTTEYEKFADAWAAATAADVTSTLTLLGNVELTAGLSSSNKFTMTLDLNGKTLGYTTNMSPTTIELIGQSSLTVKDSSEAGTGVLKAESTGGYMSTAIESSGSVTLQSGTVSAKTTDASVIAIIASTVTVEGGTVIADSKEDVLLAGANTTLTVTGGSFNATGSEISLVGGINSIITGGVFNFDPTAFLDKTHAAKFDDTQATYKWSITDAVAHDGSHGYVSVQAAITAASTTKKTVTMVANSTENVSVVTGQDITLDLNGFVLKAASAGSVITNSGTLTIKDSNTGNQTHYFTDSSGLWVWDTEENTSDAHSVTGGVITGGGSINLGGGVYNLGTLTLESGSIVGNTANYYGGGVYSKGKNAAVTMNGGRISGNKAQSGAGMNINTGATFTMNAGSVTDNTATSGSGGIYAGGTKVELLGGTVSGNKGTTGGVGAESTNITLGGSVVITGNTKADNTASNLYVSDAYYAVKVNSDFNGSVGVKTGSTTGVFTVATEAKADFFTSDNPYYIIEKNADGKLTVADPYVTIGTNGYKTVVAALAAAHDSETAAQPTILTIRRNLTENVTIPAGRNIVLDLNGFVLKGTGTGSVIANYGTLTIKDSNTGTQTHKFTVDASTGLWTLNETEGTKPVSGGVITGGTGYGGIYNEGTLTVTGGHINGNTSSYGGGIYNYSGTTTLSGNADISGNKASRDGGGVYVYYGTLNASDNVKITGNTASYGGGISSYGTANLSGSVEVSGNSASSGGGGIDTVYSSTECPGKLTVSGNVTVKDNKTQGNGGGITIYYGASAIVSENAVIADNEAAYYGGGVYLYSGTLNVSDNAKITGNSSYNGGGVYVYSGTLNVSGSAKITGNSSYNGGGIYSYGTVNLSGSVEVSGNTATVEGGGMKTYCYNTSYPGILNVIGSVTITGNTAPLAAGIADNGSVTLGGVVKITGNTITGTTDEQNLYVYTGKTVALSTDTPLASGAIVGVSMVNPGVFATGVTAAQLACFTADNAAQYVNLDNGSAKLADYDCEQLGEKTIKINSFNQPYNKPITETQALAIAKLLLPNAEDETMVAYAASGDKFACVKLDGKAWVSAGNWSLAALKENGAYIIGSAHEHDWAFTLEGNVITGICPEDNDTQVLTISAQDTTYDGKAKTATVTFTDGDGNPISSFNNETKYTIEYFVKSTEEYLDGAPVDAGTYVAEVHVCEQLDNGTQFYTAQVEFTISPAQLTVAGTLALNKTYDGTVNADVKTGIVAGKVSGDDVKVTATGTFDDKNVGEGKEVTVAYALTGDKAGNYAAPVSDTLMADVKPAKLTVTGSSMDEKMPYNGTTDALAYAHVGALDGVATADAGKVSASVKSATLAEKNIGNGKSVTITYELTGAEKENYVTPAGTILSIDVVKRQLTLSETKVGNKIYDATTKAEVTDKGTVLGVVEGEDVTVLVSSSEFADKKAATGKTVTTVFTIEGKDAGNYLAPVDGNNTADITQKPLKVTGITVKDKTYDGTAKAEATITGVEGYVSGDDVKVEVKTALFADKLAAEGKTVNVTYTITGADADNYIIDTESVFTAKATIKKAAVSVSGTTAEDKTYDGTTDATLKLGTVSGKISGDTVTVEATGKFASKNIGKQDIAVSYKLTGADAANYTVSGNNAKAEIKAKQLTVSGTTAADKEYDEATAAAVTVGTLQGVIGSEKVTLSATGNFDTADAGANKNVEVVYAISGEDIGNYLVPVKETLKATVNKAAPAEAPEYEEVLDVEDFVDEITTTPDSITIKAMEGKEYVLSTSPDDPNENQWAEAKSVKKNGDEVSFDNLDPNTPYYIHFRTSETKNTMASMCAALVIFSKAETPEITNVTGLKKLAQGTAKGDAVITIGEHGDALTADNVLAVYVDGKELTESQYKAETGCINVTLYKSFLNTLKAGKHTLTVELFGQGYDDMVLETTFTIGKPMSPKTGDTNNIALWLCLLTFCGAATVAVSKKRKEN